jgi:hypothetical protein
MSGHRELSEATGSGETEGDWVDFPASPDPDPWATLMRGANRPPDACGGWQGSEASLPARTAMTERRPLNHLASADRGEPEIAERFSFGDRWDAKRVGGAVMTSLAMALRGLLVTTTAVAIVAFLLLTNSHI